MDKVAIYTVDKTVCQAIKENWEDHDQPSSVEGVLGRHQIDSYRDKQYGNHKPIEERSMVTIGMRSQARRS